MRITKRRIRKVNNYLSEFRAGDAVFVGIPVVDVAAGRLAQVGLPDPPSIGATVLPPSDLGPVSLFNAEGRYNIRRDQPMETACRQVEWHWTEWHGPDPVEQSDVVDVPYKRYPREFIPPPSIELCVRNSARGQLLITAGPFTYSPGDTALLTHVTNLILEAFGECEFYDANLMPPITAPVRRLNWEILPAGRYPWERLEPHLRSLVHQSAEGNQPVIGWRLQHIAASNPEFVAIGKAGFHGYVVFGFPDHNVFILESIFYGNATYVFGEDWEHLSQRSKAEILAGGLQRDRIIHRKGWDRQLRRWLPR